MFNKYRIALSPIVSETPEGKLTCKIYFQVEKNFLGLFWYNYHLDWWGTSAIFSTQEEARKCIEALTTKKHLK
jgi:hypothetical protein